MNTHEDQIIAALSKLDAECDRSETLSSVLADMTRAQSFYLRVFPAIIIVAFLTLAIVAVVRFFSVDDVRSWIAYATLFIASLMVVALIKLWLYLVWVRNSVMREIKRAELRNLVAASAQK
ncbi:MAG TPA: DUF6768 family protein [Pirellulales bacterium]|jgi:ABC-type transport system involved in cytochrome bd biosynthesis fused ATPase/permease subunit